MTVCACVAWPPGGARAVLATDPAVVAELIARCQAGVVALRREIRTRQGSALFAFLREAFEEHRAVGQPIR